MPISCQYCIEFNNCTSTFQWTILAPICMLRLAQHRWHASFMHANSPLQVFYTLGSLCPSCELLPHTTVYVFSCSSHLTELDMWECLCLTLEFLLILPFFDLTHPTSEPPPSSRQESWQISSSPIIYPFNH